MRNAERVVMGSVTLEAIEGDGPLWYGIPTEVTTLISVEIGNDNVTEAHVHHYRSLVLWDAQPTLQGLTPDEGEALWNSVNDEDDYEGLPIYHVNREFYTTTGPVIIKWGCSRPTEGDYDKSYKEAKPVMNILRAALRTAGERVENPLFVFPEDENDTN